MASSSSCVHVVEPGQRVHDAGRLRVLRPGAQNISVVSTVGLVPPGDVVPPADAGVVQQLGQVGPGVVGTCRSCSPTVPGGGSGACTAGLQLIGSSSCAACRPAGDQEEVRRQAPGRVRLEHVVLEDELLCVRPVVRDLALVVVAHHVGRLCVAGQSAETPGAACSAASDHVRSCTMKPFILPPAMSLIASACACGPASWRPPSRETAGRSAAAEGPGRRHRPGLPR